MIVSAHNILCKANSCILFHAQLELLAIVNIYPNRQVQSHKSGDEAGYGQEGTHLHFLGHCAVEYHYSDTAGEAVDMSNILDMSCTA